MKSVIKYIYIKKNIFMLREFNFAALPVEDLS
jgi:hypothetical protein